MYKDSLIIVRRHTVYPGPGWKLVRIYPYTKLPQPTS